MKKIVKRGMALASATVLIAGSVPMTSINVLAAEDNGNQTAIQTQSNVTVQEDSQVTSGKWGTCDWKYADGVLTVGGGVGENTGETLRGSGGQTPGFSLVPWEELRTDIKKIVFTSNITFNEGTILNNMFSYFISLEEIDGLEKLDVSNVSEMASMFGCCYQLKSVDISSWDMRNVKDIGGMFSWCQNIQSIKFGEKQSSKLQNMRMTFYSCKSLKTLDLSMFNTENVGSVQWMFADCEELTDLNIDNFYLPKAGSFEGMFSGCKKLKNINISNFNTTNIVILSGMFEGCESLESIDVSWMNTTRVTDMGEMFSGCKSLTSLDLSSFKTGSVIYKISNMVEGCTNLKNITMPQYRDGKNRLGNTIYNDLKDIASGLEDGSWTDITGEKVYTSKPYKYEPSHTYVKGNVSQGDLRITSKVSGAIEQYTDKSDTSKKIYKYSLVFNPDARGGAGDYYYGLSVYNAETNELESESKTFTQSDELRYDATSLTGKHNFVVNVKDSSGKIVSSSPFLYDGGTEDDSSSKWGTCSWSLKDGVLTINGGVAGYLNSSSPWFDERSTIKEVNITGTVMMSKSLNSFFGGFTNLETINGLQNLVTDQVITMKSMFAGCRKLKTINGLGLLNTSSVTNMDNMFSNCQSLKSMDGIDKWDTSNVKTMNSMFDNCISLLPESVIGKLDMSNATSMNDIFSNCNKFESVDCNKMNIANATSISEMFMNCRNLKTVNNVDKIITSNITSISNMFYGCNNLTQVNGLKNVDTSNVQYFSGMFNGCAKLSNINDAEYFDTSNATNMSNMFKDCSLLKEFNMNGYDTSKLTNTSYMFANCENLTNVKMDAIDSFEVKNMSNMFYGCSSLIIMNLQKFQITAKSGRTDAFKSCNLKKVIMPSQMEENESFNKAIASALKNGKWKDITSDKIYNSIPDELVAGHTYELQEEELDTIADVINNNNLKYTVKKDSSGTQMLSGVKPELKADSFKSGFGTNVTVKSADGKELSADATVGTGCVVELTKDNKVVDTVTVVVKGDTDGNSAIDVLDMEAIQKSILGIGDKLSGAYKEAATLTEDSADITVLDMEAIQKDILGIQKIN